MLNTEETFNDITELPMIDLMLRNILVEDTKDEDISKVQIPDNGRGFVFYPSHLKTYILLKDKDTKLAVLFLEDLISYGVSGKHITNDPVIRALMETISPILDNQYARYLEYCARDKHKFDYYNHPEDRIHASSAEQIINVMDGTKI